MTPYPRHEINSMNDSKGKDKTTILVVDDTPENIDVLKGVLRNEYAIRPAINGAMALKLVGISPKPALILLDIMMPEMDGYEVCQRLKANQDTQDIPVIFITAKSNIEDELRGLEMGAVDYVTKPISPPLLKARIKSHLSLKSAHQELETKNQIMREVNNKLVASIKKLSASEEHFRSLVQTIPDIVYKIDTNGRFTFLNSAVQQLGFHPSELIGKHFSEIIHDADIDRISREKVLKIIKGYPSTSSPKFFNENRCRERVTVGLEVRLKAKPEKSKESDEQCGNHESPIVAEVNSSGLYGETPTADGPGEQRLFMGTVGVIRNIQERKEAQKKLQTAKEKAEEATRLKDKFVSLVAHDLRSPLSSMVGLLEYIVEDETTPLHKDHQDAMESVVTSGRSLIQLIEQILNIGRLRMGKITLEKSFLDAHFLTQEILQRLQHLCTKKGVRFVNRIPTSTRLFADPTLFGEVMQNLFSNAIKFSQPGGTIEVFQSGETETNLSVQDRGIGIPEETLPHLFNIAEKVSTPGTSGERGTGFGLPLSFDIMQAHGGTITVKSTQSQGSTFTVHLPLVTPKVLIVEDEQPSRTFIIQTLRPLNVEVMEAEHGRMALQLLEGNLPHLIISDIFMPGMDGFEMLEALKSNPRTSAIPVILVTGDKAIATRDQAFRLGAVDFSVKPIVVHDFLPRVRHFLGG